MKEGWIKNNISITLTYKGKKMFIVLPEELADKYEPHKLGAAIVSTWQAMKRNADEPIPLDETRAAIQELREGGGQKFDTFDEMMEDVKKL